MSGLPTLRAGEFIRTADTAMRLPLFFLLFWPFVLVGAALAGSGLLTPLLALVPLVPVAFVLFVSPTASGVALTSDEVRPAIRRVAGLAGFNVVWGVYLALVPVRNDPALVGLLVGTGVALVLLALSRRRWLAVLAMVGLGLALGGVTAVLALGGRGAVSDMYEGWVEEREAEEEAKQDSLRAKQEEQRRREAEVEATRREEEARRKKGEEEERARQAAEVARLEEERAKQRAVVVETQRREEEARRRRAAGERARVERMQREFEAIAETEASTRGWTPQTVWLRTIEGRKVVVRYSGDSQGTAARVFGRLRRLGADVSHNAVSGAGAQGGSGEIYYPHRELEAATAIQAAVVDLVWLPITSVAGAREISVWIR